MPRRRIRKTDPAARQRKMFAAQRNPGMAGVTPFGGRGGAGGLAVARSRGAADGAGTRIEHVTLYATAGQTIAAGGGDVQWDRIGPAPTEVRGFATLLDTLGTDGAVGAIPIDVTGELEMVLDGLWESYRASGAITVTRTRDGVDSTRTYNLGPIRSRAFDGSDVGWEVRAGDTITVSLPNDSGTDQVLSECQLALRIIAVASPTSPPRTPGTLWITSNDDGLVYLLDISGGGTSTVRSFSHPLEPAGVTDDGVDVWTTQNGGANTHYIFRRSRTDGTVLDQFDVPDGSMFGLGTGGIAHDGTHLWVVNYDTEKVYRVDPSDGATLQELAWTAGGSPVAHDGTNLWLARNGDHLCRVDPSDGTVLDEFVLGFTSGSIDGIAHDGTYVWVANGYQATNSPTVVAVDPADGTLGDEYALPHLAPRDIGVARGA